MWASIEEPRRHAELAIGYGHSNVLHNRDDYEDELPDLYWAYVTRPPKLKNLDLGHL